jgi:hypothetical protein
MYPELAAIIAVLAAVGYNIRVLLKWLTLPCARLSAMTLPASRNDGHRQVAWLAFFTDDVFKLIVQHVKIAGGINSALVRRPGREFLRGIWVKRPVFHLEQDSHISQGNDGMP